MHDEAELERKLWLQVIRQAQFDAEGRGEVEPYLIYRAKKWLTRMTYSFLTVCSLAGMPATQAHYLQEQERLKYSCGLDIVVRTISRVTAALSQLVTRVVPTTELSQLGTPPAQQPAPSTSCVLSGAEAPTMRCGAPFPITALSRA
jgi:hypothetical protein